MLGRAFVCLVIIGLAVTAAASGCGGDGTSRAHSAPERAPSTVAGVELVPAPPEVQEQCRQTARLVGYAVPCPGLLPVGAFPTPIANPELEDHPYAERYIHPGFFAYRDWIFLSVEFPSTVRESHLVISGSPGATDRVHFMSIEPSPLDLVEVVRTLRFRGGQAEAVHVVVSDGSIFQGHSVLLWDEGGHTYGIGFHGLDKGAERLNLALARSIQLVEPPSADAG